MRAEEAMMEELVAFLFGALSGLALFFVVLYMLYLDGKR
jgi:hypothetical protein